MQRLDVPFERRSGPERDHGAAVLRAQAHDLRHLCGALREDDDVGRRGAVVGLVVTVLLTHRGGGGDPAGKELAQLVDDRRDRFGWNAHR